MKYLKLFEDFNDKVLETIQKVEDITSYLDTTWLLR